MAINRLKVMLSFMRELNDGNISSAIDYDLEQKDFYAIIDACQDEGLIKGVRITRNDDTGEIFAVFLDNVTLTVKGMEYLDNHSAAMQTYKGLKEIREWLPF